MGAIKRMHMLITGRVHGVGFRYFVKSHANALSLTGFVRNTETGAVEIVAEGTPDALLELHQLCEHGPGHARVDEVKVIYDNASGEFSDFRIS